jgi:hypothetical protein
MVRQDNAHELALIAQEIGAARCVSQREEES